MARLEELTAGARVSGLTIPGTHEVIAAEWYGNAVLNLTFKDSAGVPHTQVLYRFDEPKLSVEDGHLPYSFDANADELRLASEAYRIHLAHLFDPYLAVHTSSVEPLPHQISAVYEEMLPRLPLRYILADDPGAGKTIMTGLLIKELIVRGDLKRCLIVAPGSLCEQWQDEMHFKFHLHFDILTNDRAESSMDGNVFNELNFCIARLDMLSRSERYQEKLRLTDWDLIVVDEAHKMSASQFGNEIHYTKRFRLGQLLSGITRHFLLLTATPHNGKNEDFELFLSLVDADRFERSGVVKTSPHAGDTSDIMRRLVKEDLLKFDGTPLFPERMAQTLNYELSSAEADLYSQVTDYVRDEFNRADKLTNERRNSVGFALTILQRRLASSPEAIYQSLRRRRERLEHLLEEKKMERRGQEYREAVFDEDYDEDDLAPDELENIEDTVAERVSASSTIYELEEEIRTLARLEKIANAVRQSGEDKKWDELSRLLQTDDNMFDGENAREKLIIFTEHRDTLRYLSTKIRNLLGREDAVVTIQGGMGRQERRNVEEQFKNEPNVRILVATDAAGEGINLQRAHLMINYDLPWNPNRLEQRFGRIHRIGQTEVCYLWNLVARETREGFVFDRLFSKLQEESKALGGKVFDILGKLSFDNKPLKDLLIEAVRRGSDPEVKARMWQVVDNSLDREHLRKLIEKNALTDNTMDFSKVMAIREEMEIAEARKLQPHFIEEFFLEAFRKLGGTIRPREHGRYQITSVPSIVRTHDALVGSREVITNEYERICFDKANVGVPESPITASLICPGHPLLDVVIELTRMRGADTLKRGSIFIDENDDSLTPRLLVTLEDAIQDGIVLPNGQQRIVSRNVHFVEMREDGSAADAGFAPYLDYRTPSEEETESIRKYLDTQSWPSGNIQPLVLEYALPNIVAPHFLEVKESVEKRMNKIAKAVEIRLTDQIHYWDYRAGELKDLEATGKGNARLSSQMAARRAEELLLRKQRRLAEIEREKNISSVPPRIVSGSLVIPVGLIAYLTGKPLPGQFSRGDKKEIETAAMNAVMEIERKLGYDPEDVSKTPCHYDILSRIPQEKRIGGKSLRFIEVKGRRAGADTVTVTKNEFRIGLNKAEDYILALCDVDGDTVHTTYLENPFRSNNYLSLNFNIKDLTQNAQIVYKD